MRKKWAIALFIYFCVSSSFAARALFRPFPCEIKKAVKFENLNRFQKEWLLLLDLLPMKYQKELEAPAPFHENARLKEQYFLGFEEIKPLVTNCEKGLAFWHRLSDEIDQFLAILPPLLADIEVIKGSLAYNELKARQKLGLKSIRPQAILKRESSKENFIRPWWKVELSLEGPRGKREEVLFKSVYFSSPGVLGALTSYELLRSWHQQYPYHFVLKDALLPAKKAQSLG